MPQACKESQLAILKTLLKRKQGVTSMEMCDLLPTVTPSRRISDLREQGWTITKKQVEGKNYCRFFGQAPESFGG